LIGRNKRFARKEDGDVSSDSEIEDYEELDFHKKGGKHNLLYTKPSKRSIVSIASIRCDAVAMWKGSNRKILAISGAVYFSQQLFCVHVRI
jgi:peroxiredoxin